MSFVKSLDQLGQDRYDTQKSVLAFHNALTRCHPFGNENIQAINYIFPNGQIELAGQWGTDATHLEATGLIKT